MLDHNILVRQFIPAGLPPLVWWQEHCAHHHQHFKDSAGCLNRSADIDPFHYYERRFIIPCQVNISFTGNTGFSFPPYNYCLGGKMPLALLLDYKHSQCCWLPVMTWCFYTGMYNSPPPPKKKNLCSAAKCFMTNASPLAWVTIYFDIYCGLQDKEWDTLGFQCMRIWKTELSLS